MIYVLEHTIPHQYYLTPMPVATLAKQLKMIYAFIFTTILILILVFIIIPILTMLMIIIHSLYLSYV